MKKIAVIGATGKSGKLIVAEALSRNLDVTAIVRNPDRLTTDILYIEKDILDMSRDDIVPFNTVVNAYGVPLGREQEHRSVVNHLAKIFSGSGTRLIWIGSAGHFYTNNSRTQKVFETVDSKWNKPSQILEEIHLSLSQLNDVNWTYIAPARDYILNGKRTGFYQSGTDTILYDKNGEPQISYADFAVALVDEIENPQYIQETFTVAAL
ncbi:NAD(P)-dependent oxidoreductase [Pedobacter antarcticus]|uniref:NAD(P)-dependent oxidoreductase n=1 Tax=Pedobacter antarcticus TaxID=34086 RepID=UPI0029311C63|nr:NAD(P)H-binding protein [Pedobacter antarcticus]